MGCFGWLWVCAGCPYIWGPPALVDDISVAGDTDTDTDADTDSDADTDTDVDTDADVDTAPTGASAESASTGPTADTRPPGTAPEIISLETHLRLDHIELAFQLADPDGDLDGGTLEWSENGVDQVPLAIPGDLDTWDAGTGVGTAILRSFVRDCTKASLDYDYDVLPIDAEGLAGVRGSTSIEIEVYGGAIASNHLGTVRAPAIVCSEFLVEDDDSDWFDIVHEPGGNWSLTLDYDASFDVDFALREKAGILVTLDTPDNPDTTTASLQSGALYRLEFARPNMDGLQLYSLTFHE